MNIVIASNIIDFWTCIEVLLRYKPSGHTDTLTEASHLLDELYKRAEMETEQQYPKALGKFRTKIKKLPTKLLQKVTSNTSLKTDKHKFLVWINLYTKSIYLNHYKLIINKVYTRCYFFDGI